MLLFAFQQKQAEIKSVITSRIWRSYIPTPNTNFTYIQNLQIDFQQILHILTFNTLIHICHKYIQTFGAYILNRHTHFTYTLTDLNKDLITYLT